jgi:protein phosphatase 1 regulatory subunit 16A
MPYDICDDEDTLDFIEAEMSRHGVTQELIDETRAATETTMLLDLQEIAAKGGDLEVADKTGATPVCKFINFTLIQFESLALRNVFI